MRPKGTQEPAADEAFAPLPPPSRKKRRSERARNSFHRPRKRSNKISGSSSRLPHLNLKEGLPAGGALIRTSSLRGGGRGDGGQSWRRINRARNVKVAGRVRAEWVIWYFNVGTLNGFLFADEFSFGWMEYVLEYDLRLSLLQKHTHTNFVHL